MPIEQVSNWRWPNNARAATDRDIPQRLSNIYVMNLIG